MMPIVRSYMCGDCGHMFSEMLSYSQVDQEPPDCPRCSSATEQEFKPVAVHGVAAGNREQARKIAEDIATNDYGVQNMNVKPYEGETPKVQYKQDTTNPERSAWVGPGAETIAGALREGRAMRQQYGSGLDVLARNLETGAQPDLIELSKRRSMKVW